MGVPSLNSGEEHKLNTQVNEEALMQRLTKARTYLVLNHPFLGSIALNLPMKLTTALPTAGVDGKNIYFNPYWISNLDDMELVFPSPSQ